MYYCLVVALLEHVELSQIAVKNCCEWPKSLCYISLQWCQNT